MIKMSTISFLFLLLTLLLHSSSAQYEQEPLAPALYAFGDSQYDAGNNNGLPTLARANFPPYGVDFVDGVTGRFSNGNNIVDYIALFLGLPFAPPYLGLSADERSKIITGINYASGAAGILPETGTRLGKVIALPEQVDFFERTVEEDLPQHFNGRKAVLDHLAKSIFMVSIGSNDYINNYLQPDFYNTSEQYTPQQFAELLVLKLSQELKRLYKLGARKIVVFELGPLGCLPIITNAIDFSAVCVEQVNLLVLEYNLRLLPLPMALNLILPGSIFVHGKAYASAYDVYHNPSRYGFKFTNIPCCVVANHGTTQCIPGLPPCEDRDQHLFYDAFHPTQAANVMLATACFNQSIITCSPFNIQQLALI